MTKDYTSFVHEGQKYSFTIVYDEIAESPREWDNLGTILYNHPRYILGDIEGHIDDVPEDVIALSVFAYEHGAITIRTAPFRDPWDSGQIGMIYVERDRVRREYGVNRISKKLHEEVLARLDSEIRVYDQYLQGDVYGFSLDKIHTCSACGSEWEENVDSCYGFYGTAWDNGMLDSIDPELHSYCKKIMEEPSEIR